MNNLNELKAKSKQIELQQIKFLGNILEEKRKHFDFTDLMFHTLSTKCEEDLIFISGLVNEWHTKAKEENKKVFLEVILSLFRIQSYVNQLETLNKEFNAKFSMDKSMYENTFSKLNSDKIKLQSDLISANEEIENLKKQIQFYEES